MCMEIKDGINLKFIDSINFMGMSLKKLPNAFSLRPESELDGDVHELAKGDFPHLMNTKEYQDYCGTFPTLAMYNVNAMPVKERETFIEWHKKQSGKVFNFQKELLSYCKLDVTILRLACLKFRDIITEITTIKSDDGDVLGVLDVFAHVTIASACMQIFRVNFIEEYYDVTLCDGRGGKALFKTGKW